MGVVVDLGLVMVDLGLVVMVVLAGTGILVAVEVVDSEDQGEEGMETNRVVVSSLRNTENHLHPTHPHLHSCLIRTPILTRTHTLTHILTRIHIPIPTHPRPPSPGPGHPAHTQRPTNPSLGQKARRRR